MELRIDKSSWKKVRLGDVAFEYSNRINNPSESEFDKFIGSSNINQWDFRVKSWEPTDSVTSAMKLFEPNDYLLVRRSLYASDFRERAPRAHFHGVCSGDILTIKENPDRISDGFLIGVLNSPDLWKFVVANASGSITRRIKWKDLANYEFLLPPKEQQAQLAELLWAADKVVEKDLEVLNIISRNRQIIFIKRLEELNGNEISLSKVLIQKKNKSTLPHIRKKYVGLEHIESGTFVCNDFMDSRSIKAQCNIFNAGDLCYSKLRPYLDKAFIANFEGISTTELLIYDTIKEIKKEYVLHHMHSQSFLSYVSGKGFGSKMPRVNHKIIGDYSIKLLSIDDQENLLFDLRKVQKVEGDLKSKIVISKALQKSLITQIF